MRSAGRIPARGSTALAVCVALAMAGALAACITYTMLQAKEARITFIKFGPDGDKHGMASKVQTINKGLDDLLRERDEVMAELDEWREGLGYESAEKAKAELERVAEMTNATTPPGTLAEALDLMKDLRDNVSGQASAARDKVRRAEQRFSETIASYGAFRKKSQEDYRQLAKDYITVESTKDAELEELNVRYADWLERHTGLALALEGSRRRFQAELQDAMRILVQQDVLAAHLLTLTRRLTDPTLLEEGSAWLAKVVYVDSSTRRVFVNTGTEQGLTPGQRINVMDPSIPDRKKGSVVIKQAFATGSIGEIVEVVDPDVPLNRGDVLEGIPPIMPTPRRAKPDGKVVGLDPETDSVAIDLGIGDGLRPQTTFAVFGMSPSGERIFKGFVSVTRVGANVSNAATKSLVDVGKPVLIGDFISSPIFPSQVTFALAGDARRFALNAEQISYLLKTKGAVVQSQVDMSTNYLVLLDVSEGSDQQKAEWEKLLSDARRLRVPILTLRDVVPFIF